MNEHLNERQRKFVDLFCSGPDGVRNNASASYKGAGYTWKNENCAAAAGARLLKHVNIIRAIQRWHAQADAATIAKLVDWKILAVESQARLAVLATGKRLDTMTKPPAFPEIDPRVVLDANLAIIERAYPKKLMLETVDHRAALAALLGVPVEDLPPLG